MAIGNDFQLDVVANAQALDKSIKAVTTTKTYKIKIEADGTQTKTLAQSTEKLANAQGQLLNVTTKYNKEGQATSAVVKDISKNVKGLGADFLETTGKVFKFGLSTAVIGAFTASITEAVQTVKEFDNAVTEFSKVSNYSREEIQAYSDTLSNLGESVYRTKTEMLDAATSFKKSGFTEEESANLARVAALYQNIADEEISASDASEVIISQMKAFSLGAEDAEHIVDAINIVSNEFAVSSSDIGKGLTAAGAALSTYGNDFEEVIGLK